MTTPASAVRRGRPPGHLFRRRPVPSWFAHVRPGDVLRWPSGDLRVVREVSRRKDGRLFFLTFAIRRPSWTRRAYTLYGAADLLTLGVEYVGVRVRLAGEVDRLLDAAIRQGAGERPFVLTARDVRGVP